MKNKKLLPVGIAVLLSGILLVATALTGNAASNAYEQFKELLHQDPVQFENATVGVNIDISDNGEKILHLGGSVKADKDSTNMSGKFELSGKGPEKAFEVYGNKDDVLLHVEGSENWYQAANHKSEADEEEGPRGHFGDKDWNDGKNLRDALLDTLMGDLKDQVKLAEADGLRTFSLTLDKGNMPILLQTAFSAAGEVHKEAELSTVCDLTGLPEELQDVIADMAAYRNLIDISGERTLEKIVISLTVDRDNQPKMFELTTSFSGISKDGGKHNYEINGFVALSNVNETTIDTVNVDPSSIITIDTSKFENIRDNRRMHR